MKSFFEGIRTMFGDPDFLIPVIMVWAGFLLVTAALILSVII